MFRIISRETLATKIRLSRIEGPAIARKALAGQFVVVRIDENGERIPLTIADWDKEEGNVTIVFMQVGTTTEKLALLVSGDSILNFVGPLGRPTEIENFGTVVCIAGGFAIATSSEDVKKLCATTTRRLVTFGKHQQQGNRYSGKLRTCQPRKDGTYV